jgi:hypothetical protein
VNRVWGDGKKSNGRVTPVSRGGDNPGVGRGVARRSLEKGQGVDMFWFLSWPVGTKVFILFFFSKLYI